MSYQLYNQGVNHKRPGEDIAELSLNQWSNSIAHKVYPAKQALYFAGDCFEGLYQLRSGSAKSILTTVNGVELITQFFLPGDLIGEDGFHNNSYAHNVYFLETSSVIFLGATRVRYLLANSEAFRSRLLHSMSHKLTQEQHLLLYYNHLSGEQRVAQFLFQTSRRFEQQGLSAKLFRLPMTRTDLANYLGMAIETLSRVIAQLQHQNLVKIEHRMVEIPDRDYLIQTLGLQNPLFNE